MSSLHDVQLWRLLYWCLLWSHTLWLFCEHAYRFTEHKCFLLLSLTSVLFTTILSFNICLWGATIVHDKTPTFTFLLHNWIIKLCLKIKNKSCPDKELVSVPRELLMLIHLKKNKIRQKKSRLLEASLVRKRMASLKIGKTSWLFERPLNLLNMILVHEFLIFYIDSFSNCCNLKTVFIFEEKPKES